MLVPSRLGKRSNAREELRRRAAYVVNNSDDKTRFTAVMTPEAAAVYFNAITTKKAGKCVIDSSELSMNILSFFLFTIHIVLPAPRYPYPCPYPVPYLSMAPS